MARDKGQTMMFTKADMALFKAVFADNEDLLYLVRKVLLQFPLTKEEKKVIKESISPEAHALLKKRIFPDWDADAPFGQIADFYQTLTNDLTKKDVKEMAPLFKAKDLECDYLMQQFEVLKDIDADVEQKIILSDLASLKYKDDETMYVHTTARNYLLAYISQMLILIKDLAGKKDETPDETEKRLMKDSTK